MLEPVDCVRTYEVGGVKSLAIFDGDQKYRYWLARVWEPEMPMLNFLMLNPSTASEVVDDPTVHRCRTRAKLLGYGGLVVTNLFALRSTDPNGLRGNLHPRSEAARASRNDEAICLANTLCARTVAAWGVHGAYSGRSEEVLANGLDNLYHLGKTKNGHPRHPLYLGYGVTMQPWE